MPALLSKVELAPPSLGEFPSPAPPTTFGVVDRDSTEDNRQRRNLVAEQRPGAPIDLFRIGGPGLADSGRDLVGNVESRFGWLA
jgi:hypothetical protein